MYVAAGSDPFLLIERGEGATLHSLTLAGPTEGPDSLTCQDLTYQGPGIHSIMTWLTEV